MGFAQRRVLAAALVAAMLTPTAWAQGPIGAISSAPDARQALAGAALVRALRAGGYVVYFRHTATDFSKNDAGMQSVDDCANQRPLTGQGRQDALTIGQHIRALRLAEGEVLASPLCRTMQHALLSFGHAVPTPALRESRGGEYPGLKQLLRQPVPTGRNRWLVSHGHPLRAVAGPPHLDEGEAVVLRPAADGWIVVARIGVADWVNLPP